MITSNVPVNVKVVNADEIGGSSQIQQPIRVVNQYGNENFKVVPASRPSWDYSLFPVYDARTNLMIEVDYSDQFESNRFKDRIVVPIQAISAISDTQNDVAAIIKSVCERLAKTYASLRWGGAGYISTCNFGVTALDCNISDINYRVHCAIEATSNTSPIFSLNTTIEIIP